MFFIQTSSPSGIKKRINIFEFLAEVLEEASKFPLLRMLTPSSPETTVSFWLASANLVLTDEVFDNSSVVLAVT